ncbi:MAG TPA: site-2 protease family protein [Planctomycetaceae bacterium]|nr:site-2 protease family protein [Planctomycetaceae bacterium]
MSSDQPQLPRPDPPRDADPPPRVVPPEKVIVIGRPEQGEWVFAGRPPRPRSSRRRLALILFVLTCLSTFLVGFFGEPVIPDLAFLRQLWNMGSDERLARLANGLGYMACIMGVLGAHELGHYLQALRYGVPASLPYFIPLPISPIGTMGAVIVQQPGIANRKSMFDIAITGPLAGLVVALPLAIWGVMTARMVEELPSGRSILVFEDPLLLRWLIDALRGPGDLRVNPMLFAGWVGIFITALNLIPIGQLDGGHILYCLIRRRAHYVARGLFYFAAGMVAINVLFGNGSFGSWWLMLFLIWMFGTRHPPTANDNVKLGPVRIVLGWLTLTFVFLGLTPTPMYELEPKSKSRPPVHRNVEEEIRARTEKARRSIEVERLDPAGRRLAAGGAL